ncbi:Ldh family oxidoreductase [Ammoniphilus resinae]|uniref:LDH2 family malate/lactate/ureidoglycolate dehydrogenase n=1 Tax=Ammoniphilus resinae TaxID=861532 RepID=A0ABS4GNR2_9BACL|nr:Ldh family oxidoreductase [Ammoniphilus resinae]MBP1931925.1 LDH2 family malate/lactate/ureidoglycolate dehydrogenase [Ammoniphilus resinae]
MKRYNAEKLKQLIIDSFMAAGLDQEQAEITGQHLIFADQHGVDTHGILRLPIYIKRIQEGLINKTPNLEWSNETNSSAVLDADNGMGHYITHLAMQKAIEKAKQHTISFITVKNGNHFGALASYTKMAAKQKMIGFITTNTAPLMAPTGGAERVLGNNPLSFAVPRKNEPPVVLDMACSNVAGGKLVLASKKGESIPLGWALDREGRPTTDPFEGFENGGVLLPIGGHKGYGLSLIMDILTGVLSGSNYGKNVNRLYDTSKVTGIGYSMMVLNIESFLPMDIFEDRLEDLLHMVENSKKAMDVERIYLPGQMEEKIIRERLEQGVPLPDKLHAELLELSSELGLDKGQYGL